MKFTFASCLLIAMTAACGDDSGSNMQPDGGAGADGTALRNCAANGGADCFDMPTGVLSVGAQATAPDFSCSEVPLATAEHAITVSGTVFDFQFQDQAIPNATLDVFFEDVTGAPDMTITANASGAYTVTLTGAKNRMHWRSNRPSTASPQGLPTYAINEPLDILANDVMDDRYNVSLTTANALPALIGVDRTEGLGVVAGAVVDCAGDDVTHAIGTLATAPSDGNPANIQFLPGAAVYYFNSDDLPVRHNDTASGRLDSSENGLLVVIEIPPTAGSDRVYLQVWGFLTAEDMAMGQAGLTLLSEIPSPVIADSVISSTMAPNKGPL